MATLTHDDENLPETDEVYYLNTKIIDDEPFYKNFTTIHNTHRRRDEGRQLINTIFGSMPLHPIDNNYQTRSFRSKKVTYVDADNSSESVDDQIDNLIKIVEDIGYNPQSPFIHACQRIDTNQLPVIVSTFNDLHELYDDQQHSHIDEQYLQNSYQDTHQCSASTVQCNPVNHMTKKTTQISNDDQSDITIPSSLSFHIVPEPMEEERFQDNIHRMYGFDDGETVSAVSSRRSSVDENNSHVLSSSSSSSTLSAATETIAELKPKQQITIREYYPTQEVNSLVVNRSLSPVSQQTNEDHYYEQFIKNHPDVFNDPNPEIIKRPHPDELTYKQNVSIRYLLPPTPPPPGPLIIREILPRRATPPPPIVIKHQDPSPPTPPPLILREAPPTPPPSNQEPKIITKVIPAEPLSKQQITEKQSALPPKPQSIIIEKWLPYKPRPPREVIYERIVEPPVMSEFQPGGPMVTQDRRRSIEPFSKSFSRVPIPVHIEQSNSISYLDNKPPTTFDQFARATQLQLEELQNRVVKQIQTHKQWIAEQHQQHMNRYRSVPTQLTTPALIINHPPIVRATTAYVPRADVHQAIYYHPAFMYPSYT